MSIPVSGEVLRESERALDSARRMYSEAIELMRAQEDLLTAAVEEHDGKLPPEHPVRAALLAAARNVLERLEAWERLDPEGADQDPETATAYEARRHVDREFLKQDPMTPALATESGKQEARNATAGLRVDVQRVLQRGTGERAQYDLELKDGALIPIGTINKLLGYLPVRNAIARERHVLISVKKDGWTEVCARSDEIPRRVVEHG